MAAREVKYPLTITLSRVEKLNVNMGVNHEEPVSPAISVNVR